MSSLQKSPKVSAQEQQIAELEKEISKVKRVIKSLKTRLEKTQASFEQTQRDIFNKTTSALDELMKKTNAVLEALTKLLKKKKLPFHYREMLTMMKEEISLQLEMGGMQEAFEVPEEFKKEKAESHDIFEKFRVEPPKEEKKKIRQLYLHLSKKFHPDKASSETEAERFKTIQQQLVQAYQMNDLHALEELSVWYGVDDQAARELSTDDLQQQIARMERQLASLVLQKERLSEEIKRFRKSDMGKMLTEFDAMKRRRESPLAVIDDMLLALTEMDSMVAILEKVNKTNRFELLEELVPEPEPQGDDLFGSFLEMLEQEDVPPFSVEENFNPKFKKGSWVQIHWDKAMLKNYFGLDGMRLKKLPVLEGVVLDSVFHPVYGHPICIVFLSVESLAKLPNEALEVAINRSGFGTLTVNEEDLRKTKRPSAARLKHQRRLYDEIWMKYAFADDSPEIQDAIAKMTAKSSDTKPQHLAVDEFMTELFHENSTLKTDYYFSRLSTKKLTTVELMYQGFQPEKGYTVVLKNGRYSREEQVAELFVNEDRYPVLNNLIDAFAIWEEMYLDTYATVD